MLLWQKNKSNMEEDFSKYNGEGTLLRKAQLRMLDILIAVDKICRKHNICYWLDGGTCLGAVRHGGFIPWDDDVDIAVMRKDYYKLCAILKKELPDNLVFQDKTTDKNYPSLFAKVRDRQSWLAIKGDKGKEKEKGLYIDIFPIEKGTKQIKAFVDFFYRRAFRRLHGLAANKFELIVAGLVWLPACCLVYAARFFSFLLPKDALIYAYGVTTLKHYQLNKKDFLPAKPIIFEGKTFMGPANPDGYLKRLYGDYMKIPPPEKRQFHAVEMKIW
jgi:lipopolysaccharide cholinephosphotransferase